MQLCNQLKSDENNSSLRCLLLPLHSTVTLKNGGKKLFCSHLFSRQLHQKPSLSCGHPLAVSVSPLFFSGVHCHQGTLRLHYQIYSQFFSINCIVLVYSDDEYTTGLRKFSNYRSLVLIFWRSLKEKFVSSSVSIDYSCIVDYNNTRRFIGMTQKRGPGLVG